ncbi:hypothetical protein L596_015311 [Steinernema carpocapsae]|uniref:PABS domain-containing protein n=1 Tax=Steinernema carpocapsae TaxID=34508 RepID=A0A4U5NFM1_STECR|nr:hypothetical protein L596_015311 [Steinernema carpocapsae]
MRSLAVFLIFLGLVQSQFIDATVCSNLQKVCFDIVHDSFEEGLFRAVTFQSGDLKGGEAYMSRVSLRAPRNTDLASLTPEERLALPVDGSRPLFSIIEPIVEPLIANLLNEDLLQVLNIGLGAGSVDLYLNSLEKRPNLTTVEIDPAMIEIAREYFGHVDDELHRILLDDGLEVLKRSREAGKTFNFLIIDACAGTEYSEFICPVKPLLSAEAVNLIYENLDCGGMTSLNVLSGSEEIEAFIEEVNV